MAFLHSNVLIISEFFYQEICTTEAAEFAEFGELFNQELFTRRPEPALSDVEGRLSLENCG
jgi:hypothetical protein